MKKVFLFFFLFYMIMPDCAIAQSTYKLISDVFLVNDGNGQNVVLKWDPISAWEDLVPSATWGSGELIVSSGATLTIGATYHFDGTIVVKSGGHIVFDRDQPNEGELIMNAASKIIMESGSTISSTGPADDNRNFLQIGDHKIDGGEINDLPDPPFMLDASYMECMDDFGVVNCTPTPQPVTLLYFKAQAQQQSVEINWASSKAWDFSHYELERSADGTNFDYVATIDAAELSNETVEFSYSDRQPFFGTSYYRLKAVDVDGAFEYKEMAAVKFGSETFSVFPNPSALGYINISWSHAVEGARVSLSDNTGRIVRTVVLNKNPPSISTEGLMAGIYLLSVQSPAGSKHAQVLIQ